MEKLINKGLDDEKTSLTLNEFTKHFHTFPLRFDERNFNYWWAFFIVFYLIWGILIALWDTHTSMVYHGFLCQTSDYYYVIKDFSCSLTLRVTRGEYLYHFFIIGQFLLLWLFNIWRKKIPGFFQDLQTKKIISFSGDPARCHLESCVTRKRKQAGLVPTLLS